MLRKARSVLFSMFFGTSCQRGRTCYFPVLSFIVEAFNIFSIRNAIPNPIILDVLPLHLMGGSTIEICFWCMPCADETYNQHWGKF